MKFNKIPFFVLLINNKDFFNDSIWIYSLLILVYGCNIYSVKCKSSQDIYTFCFCVCKSTSRGENQKGVSDISPTLQERQN